MFEINFIKDPISMPIIQANYLPINVSYPACDIDTKEEVKIHSDDLIECVEINRILYVSPRLYEQFLKLPTL